MKQIRKPDILLFISRLLFSECKCKEETGSETGDTGHRGEAGNGSIHEQDL
jgi:hypothetical protein